MDAPMSGESSYKSIAEALAAAEKERARKAAVSASRTGPWFRAGPSSAPAARTAAGGPPAPRSTTSNIAELRDEFDDAIEAVETARKTMGSDRLGAERMATNVLMAKRRLSRSDAEALVKRAVRYIDG